MRSFLKFSNLHFYAERAIARALHLPKGFPWVAGLEYARTRNDDVHARTIHLRNIIEFYAAVRFDGAVECFAFDPSS